MNLIKFPLSNTKGKEISLPNNLTLTNETENVITSLPYQTWEIEEIINNFSETEQDMLIEKISDQVQEWELTLDANLELWLRTKHKESKGNISYIDFLYDLAQEQVYRAYAIEKLNEQKNKAPLVGSNDSVNDKPISFSTSNNQTATTTAATPTELSANQTTNNNSLLDYEEQINQIIANLSEAQQDVLMEKTVLLLDEWESTGDKGLELALRTQHQKHQSHISYQDFLYELAQSQVYRDYAIEQIELAKQNNAKFIGQFVEIEKVYCDKLTNANDGNVDDFNFNDKEATRDEVISIGETNHLINYLNQESVVSQDSDSLENCLQHTNSNQGHQNEINKPLIVSNNNYHTTKVLPNYSSKFPIKYINQQSSSFSSTSYTWDNSLLLTKAKIALPIPSYLGKHTNIYHPPSLPP